MKEKILFELYKDSCKINKKPFRDELRKKFKDVDISSVRANITKYQIKKYGYVLDSMVESQTKEEAQTKYNNSRKRKYNKGIRKVK